MLDFLELEETVGRAWHRLIGKTGSWPQYPDQAVKLADIRQRLAICFRGFGGDVAVQIAQPVPVPPGIGWAYGSVWLWARRN
ncbi:hypothetical protein D9M70_650300 [compost metagenome]